jgi:hypothetical protein
MGLDPEEITNNSYSQGAVQQKERMQRIQEQYPNY